MWLAAPLPNADVTHPPGADDLTRLPCTLSVDRHLEVDDARRRFRRSIQEILLAALGRTIAQTVGDGVLAVELEGEGRSVLRPDVDVRRTVGWFTTYYPVPLACANGGAAISNSTPSTTPLNPFRTTELDTGCCDMSTRRPVASLVRNVHPTSTSGMWA